jgi:hypothetical protein
MYTDKNNEFDLPLFSYSCSSVKSVVKPLLELHFLAAFLQ